MKLKLINKTLWSTRDLRRFVLAGLRAKGTHASGRPYKVTIVYGRRRAHTGLAYIGAPAFKLTLPGPARVETCRNVGIEAIDYLELAQVLEHEVDHTLGLEHADMLEWWQLKPTWHEGLTIAWEQPRQAALSATIEMRASRARYRLKLAETRLKRAKTIRDKWAAKVKYYDKRAP